MNLIVNKNYWNVSKDILATYEFDSLSDFSQWQNQLEKFWNKEFSFKN